jgi:hypothetical protein
MFLIGIYTIAYACSPRSMVTHASIVTGIETRRRTYVVFSILNATSNTICETRVHMSAYMVISTFTLRLILNHFCVAIAVGAVVLQLFPPAPSVIDTL